MVQLLRLGKLGSFDFNSRFYADDDLIVGAADPFQLFRILYEVIRGGGSDRDTDVALMLDQCHNVEEKIPGQIRSVLNVQEMTAQGAAHRPAGAMEAAQAAGELVLGAHAVVMDAFYTDVRPDLAAWRESRGLPADPVRSLRRIGLPEADRKRTASAANKRAGGRESLGAGWLGTAGPARGYPIRPSQARAPARPATPLHGSPQPRAIPAEATQRYEAKESSNDQTRQ